MTVELGESGFFNELTLVSLVEMDGNGGCLEFDTILDHVDPRSEPNLKASVIVP